MLLTGGISRRMGFPKGDLVVDGVRNVDRLSALMSWCCPAIELGPGYSSLPRVEERPRGGGPLVAIAAGWEWLSVAARVPTAVLVLACDLPLFDLEALIEIESFPDDRSVVPIIDGRPQPLCARWTASDLDVARELVAAGSRTMKALVEACAPVELDVSSLKRLRWQLSDVDTTDDLRRLGIAWDVRNRDAKD